VQKFARFLNDTWDSQPTIGQLLLVWNLAGLTERPVTKRWYNNYAHHRKLFKRAWTIFVLLQHAMAKSFQEAESMHQGFFRNEGCECCHNSSYSTMQDGNTKNPNSLAISAGNENKANRIRDE
jgi:hypothetical protein